jgi:hypothetical protein
VAGTYYRLVRRSPPTRADFLSRKERGIPPRGPELSDPFLYEGISTWDTPAAAASVALRRPAIIAVLEIPEDAPITVRQTLKPGHYTLRGAPETLLACVVSLLTY